MGYSEVEGFIGRFLDLSRIAGSRYTQKYLTENNSGGDSVLPAIRQSIAAEGPELA
jgi:hypothetical protein